MKSILSGAIAGGITTAFIYPTSVIRIRLSMDVGPKTDREFSGMANCLRHCGKRRFLDLYRGFWASMVHGFVYRGLYFGLYDIGKTMFLRDSGSNHIWAAYGGIAFLTTFLS